MTRRWIYDHEYFQRMIDRDNRDNLDMNTARVIDKSNPNMIALGIEQGIYEGVTVNCLVDS